MNQIIETKFRVAGFKYAVKLEYQGERIFVHFGYSKALIAEVKAMEGAKYHGFDEPVPRKVWSIKNSARNQFQLRFLTGENPYAFYDRPLMHLDFVRPLMQHQRDLVEHGLTYRRCIVAADTGTGKTLAAYEVAERATGPDGQPIKWGWWIGPKSGLVSVKIERMKWKIDPTITFEFFTYEELKKRVDSFTPATGVPCFIVFDESHRVKTPTAQRSQAAKIVADRCREMYGDFAYIIEMSGTASPKAPTDWWHQSEIACPGFLKEGSLDALRFRLAIIQSMESAAGGSFPKMIGWRDNELKCDKCGKFKDDKIHEDPLFGGDHPFMPSKNEVALLYQRLKGLVIVKLKKDCLDLPDKIYRVIKCKPKQDVLRLAKTITATSSRAIQALTLLRELSDGFQYDYSQTDGTVTCELCEGKKTILDFNENNEQERIVCPHCEGEGVTPRYIRTQNDIACPKDDALEDLLEEMGEIGRIVIFAAFTGSIDHIVDLCKRNKWSVIRVDGRGWQFISEQGIEDVEPEEMIARFQKINPDYVTTNIAFVAHPASGSEGLTLTAACMIVFFSNTFTATHRMQAENRIHRLSMDTNRGATIVDLIHLETDQLVLDNNLKKKKLQAMTLGDVRAALEAST